MHLATLLSLFVTYLPASGTISLPTHSEALPVTVEASAEQLTAGWDEDVLVLAGLHGGEVVRVYDIVGHLLTEFRSESPGARIRLQKRQLVAVCAEGHCVGAR